MTHLLAQLNGPPLFANPIDDLRQMLHYDFMRNAFATAAVVALVAGAAGYFVVLRAVSFAGHALAEIGFAGATGAVAIGINPLIGLLVLSTGGGVAIGLLGRRVYGRDVAIGIVLALALGLGSLFLSLYPREASETTAILFGEIFGITSQAVVITLVAGGCTGLALIALYRPLLFASIDPEVAEARGVPVRLLSIGFMVVLAFAVSVSVQVVGVLLIFALLVAPAAIAQRISHRPGRALLMSMALALCIAWTGIVLAYYIPAPVGFFVTMLAFAGYIAARVAPVTHRQ